MHQSEKTRKYIQNVNAYTKCISRVYRYVPTLHHHHHHRFDYTKRTFILLNKHEDGKIVMPILLKF